MTIATEKTKNASERFSLVRLSPGRFLDASRDWQSVGGDKWSLYVPDLPPIFMLTAGTSPVPFIMTRVPVGSLITGGNWSYDESTKILTLSISNAFPPQDADLVIAYYYLFFTSGQHRQWNEDPDDSSSTLRDWSPRLASEPTISQDFSNSRNGFLSIAESQISLVNTDGFFEQYLGPNDSFYNKDAKIWVYVNGLANGLRVFHGTVSAVKISLEALTLSVTEQFIKLNAQAYAGTDLAGATAPSDTIAQDIGKPLPLIMGRTSWAKYTPHNNGPGFAFSDGLKGFVKNYQKASTTTNREWYLARATAGLNVQAFGSVTRTITDTTGLNDLYLVKFSSFGNIRDGDTIKWTTSSSPRWGICIAQGTDIITYLGLTYDLVIMDTGSGGSMTNSSVFVPLKTLALCIFNSGVQTGLPLQDKDYSITTTDFSNPEQYKRFSINFVNNFEATYYLDGTVTAGAILNPSRMDVRFSFQVTQAYSSHGKALKTLFEQAGMTTNAASFLIADAELAEDVCFSIPNIDENRYGTYLSYIQALLASTAGYVWINNAGEVVYQLLFAPGAGDPKDDDLTHVGSVHSSINYNDIVTSYTPQNTHRQQFGTLSLTVFPGEFGKAIALHGVYNAKTFRHVMAGAYNLRAAQIIAMQCNPQVVYDYETSADDIDSILGQDVTLNGQRILGGLGIKNIKIVSVEKSAAKTTIRATDLQGL